MTRWDIADPDDFMLMNPFSLMRRVTEEMDRAFRDTGPAARRRQPGFRR